MNIYGRMARISRPKLSGVSRHEGVLLPTGDVAHTTQDKGAHVCSWAQFKGNHPIKIERELHPVMHQQALLRLQDLLEKRHPYDPVLNNCEIFARTILLEEPQSPQVGFWMVAAFFAALWLGAAG
ncbi:MAG: NC domain protein [Burkholderiales bacterium]|nr:NC domain protein [Burkholderiales bacterium]